MIIVVALACVSFAFLFSLCILSIVMKKKSPPTPPEDTEPESSTKSSGGEWKTTAVTFYGQTAADDNGLGFSGIDLFKYGKSGVKFDGKPLFPAAVFQGDGAKYLYKVLEVKCDKFTKNKSVYVHVVDVCNSGQGVCKTNSSKHGNFLVDIHKTAFEYIGLGDGLHKAQFRSVGEIAPNKINKSNFRGGGSIICKCTGDCTGKNVVWKKYGSC